MSIQNWNNLLNYIKMNLGAPLNAIELSDDDIIKYIKENTLVEFSNYVPKRKYYLLDYSDLIDERIQKYRINTDDYIIDINDIYLIDSSELTDISNNKIVDSLMMAKFLSGVNSLKSRITWRFEQPNYIIFYDSLANITLPALIEYATIHTDLKSIPADMYQLFKKLALADIKILLGNMRSKYQLSTPFGQIINNAEILKQEGEQSKQMVIETLINGLPPDKFVEFL